MKLHARLPDSVTVNGRKVPVDLDFRNVLRMMEVLSDETLIPEAREYLAVKCVTKHPRKAHETLAAVKEILFPVQQKGKDTPKITDFEQDAGMIRAAFRQVYGIDLWRDKLHWLEFVDLLHNLPEGNRYMETLSIRARPIPAPDKYNKKEREWLINAKAAVALHLPEEEARKKYEAQVGKVFLGLMAMMGRGEMNGE